LRRIVDQRLPPECAAWLRSNSVDAIHVREFGAQSWEAVAEQLPGGERVVEIR
jgi:predicted nuclease of predicted toxin-antitoxin system